MKRGKTITLSMDMLGTNYRINYQTKNCDPI
jgi:hypothetical protein